MRPRRVKKEACCFDPSVGSTSGGHGESTRRQMIRQKVHLNRDLSTCLIDDPVDFASTASTHDNPLALIQRIT